MIAVVSVSEVNNLVNSFNWSQPSWDLFIFAGWAIASVIYAFAAGRGRIVNILISVYMAKLLVTEAPFLSKAITSNLPSTLLSVQQLVTFLIIFLVLFLLMGRYVFRTSADSKHFSSILFGIIFAVLELGLLINVIVTYLPHTITQNFSPLTRLVFLDNPATFVWLLLPLIFLIALGKFVGEGNEV